MTIEGPVPADGPDISRATHLLNTILIIIDAAPYLRARGGLRIVTAHALGILDLPPYTSLNAFADALTRFAAPDVPSIVRELYAAWSASSQAGTITVAESKPDLSDADVGPQDPDEPSNGEFLTISDIRRARRETRLTLAEVSERCRIPAWLLRELEWGYFRNWPAGLHGRTQLVHYARAAGLDERLVVRTIWPSLETAARRRGSSSVAPEDLEPADPEQVNAAAMLVPIERGPLAPSRPEPATRHKYRLAAAVAIVAMLIVALMPAAWERWSGRPVDEAQGPPLNKAQGPPFKAQDPPSSKAEGSSAQAVAADKQAPTTRTAHPDPILRQTVEPPGFGAVGAASFQPDDVGVLMRASYDDGMMLRIARVDDGARNYHARMSPDGRWITFDSDRDGERGVYVAGADGSNVRRVSGDGFAALPGWSPDSRTLLYTRAEEASPDVWNLWKVGVETGRPERLTSHESGQPWGGSWFPDGRRIAYSRDAKLVVLDTETGSEIEFRSPVQGRAIRSPAVSPDGRHVVFQVTRNGAWLLSVPNGSTRRLLDDPSADAFSWAPDGRRFAYYSGRSGGWNVWLKLGTW